MQPVCASSPNMLSLCVSPIKSEHLNCFPKIFCCPVGRYRFSLDSHFAQTSLEMLQWPQNLLISTTNVTTCYYYFQCLTEEWEVYINGKCRIFSVFMFICHCCSSSARGMSPYINLLHSVGVMWYVKPPYH